ncbi:MAG: hypothetical protein K2P73_09920 [Lachnospiraceae bacterium]|nr:hypothetical protein [Lachnospiraceae bacterium]
MAMRITTKMMHNTSLRNLNINKLRQEKLTNQMSTGKKITRPSDDPVIAIRSLKLNSSLDKIDQYYEKNASDAESWLELTESALSTVNDILTNDIRKNIIGAKSSYMTVEDREAVITHLRKAMEEIYATGNSDSGGRSIFTGYRTDMPLTLTAAKKEYNRITEQFLNDTIDKLTFVYAGDIGTINEGNFKDVDDITKKEITSNEIYRKRLAYGNLDLKQVMDPATGKPVEPIKYESNIDIGYMSDAKFDGDGVKIATTSVSSYVTIDTSEIPNEAVFTLTVADDADSPYTVRIPKGKDSTMTDPSIVIEDKNGPGATLPAGIRVSYEEDGTIKMANDKLEPKETAIIGSSVTKDAKGKSVVEFDKKFETSFTIEPDHIFASGSNDAYMSVVGEANKNKISYIAETGELLFGDAIAERFKHLPADTEMRVSYDKSDWKKGDIDPVHYFYTEREGKTASGKDKTLVFNEGFLDDPSRNSKQIIEYDIGNNQSLQVNTTADEAFSHALGRDVEEVISMLEEYGRYQSSLAEVEKLIKSEKYDGTDDALKLERQKEALEEAMTRVLDKINKRSDELVEDCDGYFAKTQLAETDCGARLARLKLVQNRLEMQQTNFGELVSENEDADYTDLVIQMKSIEMTYQAALSSISYTMQTSLLDFIR